MNVLVPLDGPPSEDVMFDYCRSLAVDGDPAFVLAHIVTLPRFVDPDHARASEQYLADVLRKFRAAGMRATTVVRQGEPGAAIVALGRLVNADLIVLPSHRGRWLDRHPHEDVLEYILLHADRPVIAINDQGIASEQRASDIFGRHADAAQVTG